MLFQSAVFAALLTTNVAADHHMKGLGGRTHMWAFGGNGVSIYKPDGEEVKSIGPEKACYNVTRDDGSFRIRCDFNDVESDGKKYVWAAVARGESKIDVFSIDSGDMLGAFPTCNDPRDLEFHPLREEMWVHCSDISDIEKSHMDVFSTASPSSPISTRILMHNTTEDLRSYGRTIVDASLGDVAYSTVYGIPTLFKVSLSDREVMKEIKLVDDDSLYGYYDMTYSLVNQHVFVRTQVCCSCNFEGADTLECDRYGSFNITMDGKEVEGQCGRHCVGGKRDTMGILEFDTNTDTVVGKHSFVGNAPVATPFSSPDGEYIVLFGMNGGKLVQILKAGMNGKKSEVAYEIELDFNTTLAEDDNVYNDFAFIKHKNMNLFVLSSSAENKVAIVDMSKDQPEASYVQLKNEAFSGRTRSRQVEWAAGTDYVWISGRNYDEIYVVDFVKKELVKTFTDFNVRKLLSVVNNEFLDLSSAIENQWVETDVFSKSMKATSKDADENSSDTKLMSFVAIILSFITLLAVIGNVVAMKNQKDKMAQMMRMNQMKISESETRPEVSTTAPLNQKPVSIPIQESYAA